MTDQTPPPPAPPGPTPAPAYAPNPYAATPQPMSPADEKLWATLIHIGGIIIGWIAPLIGYLVLKDRGPFVRAHTASALNFHLTMLIGIAIGFVLMLVFIGYLLIVAISILILIFEILAAIAANRGEYYTYPIAIKFVS